MYAVCAVCVVCAVSGRSISSSFLSLLAPQRRQSDAHEEMNSSMSNLEPVLLRISEASERVMKNQKESAGEYMAVHSMMGLEMAVRDMDRSDEEDSDDEAVKGAQPKMKRTPRVTSNTGLFLSLFVTFLYQMNQYVVAPTSGQYSDKLGMSAGLSGLIIGLSPLAALVSAMIYSVWTNYSFKQPLVTSLLFLVSGNLFYAMALQCQSPHYIFIGRLLTGLGGPRGITRRYIADHVSLADRTEASSYFVTAGAMGLACGPLMSSLVSACRYSFVTHWNGVIMIQYELVTAPGWIMFLFFAGTLLAVIFGFDDPEIKKQKTTVRGVSGKKNTPEKKNSLSDIFTYVYGIFFPGPRPSGSSSTNLVGDRIGGGKYGAIPVQEQVVCVELGDLLERGDMLESDSSDGYELTDIKKPKMKTTFAGSCGRLESTMEGDECSSEPGSPEGPRDGVSPVSVSPRDNEGSGKSSISASASASASAVVLNALRPRREASKSDDYLDNVSTNSSMRLSSINTSRSTSRRSSAETLESGKDTLSALDVRTAGKIRAVPFSSSGANGSEHYDEDSRLYEAPSTMSSTGKLTMVGLGSTYTYNYSQRNLVDDDDSCWLCCDLFGAEVSQPVCVCVCVLERLYMRVCMRVCVCVSVNLRVRVQESGIEGQTLFLHSDFLFFGLTFSYFSYSFFLFFPLFS